jgi:hypothetical protein
MQVGQVQWFAFLGSAIRLMIRGEDSLPTGSVEQVW